jgi:hypothetical protein
LVQAGRVLVALVAAALVATLVETEITLRFLVLFQLVVAVVVPFKQQEIMVVLVVEAVVEVFQELPLGEQEHRCKELVVALGPLVFLMLTVARRHPLEVVVVLVLLVQMLQAILPEKVATDLLTYSAQVQTKHEQVVVAGQFVQVMVQHQEYQELGRAEEQVAVVKGQFFQLEALVQEYQPLEAVVVVVILTALLFQRQAALASS